jgi:hypothetical protein
LTHAGNELIMSRLSILVALAVAAIGFWPTCCPAQIFITRNEDGLLSFRAEGDQVGAEVVGLNLLSSAGLLLPDPNEPPDPSPFTVLLESNPDQIAYGILPDPLVLGPEQFLTAGYQGSRGQFLAADFEFDWGNDTQNDATVLEYIPEPSAAALAWLSLLVGLPTLRRWKFSHPAETTAREG